MALQIELPDELEQKVREYAARENISLSECLLPLISAKFGGRSSTAEVFLIYRNQIFREKLWGQKLCTLLEAQGISTGSLQKIIPGRDWRQQFLGHIKKAKCVILLLSKASSLSEITTDAFKEVEYLQSRKEHSPNMILILTEQVEPSVLVEAKCSFTLFDWAKEENLSETDSFSVWEELISLVKNSIDF